MNHTDTIVARATPPGRGGIGIVRVSGPAVPIIAEALLGLVPAPRHALHCRFRDARGQPIDDGLALYFPAPHSYTGETVLELHGHGGPVVTDMLVGRVLELGARLAQPGEFSQRAFLNDKLDLTQAEAIADLIDSGSSEAARAALRSLQGEFSAMVQGLADTLTDLRMRVEAAIDFPDEEIDLLEDEQISSRLEAVLAQFDAITAAARQGQLLRDGMTVVIAGAPNAGKSSLLNRLAGYDAAIVTAIPGTTRDILRERIDIDGMPLHVIDTAGLRDVRDAVEEEGIRRARAEMSRADRILFVVDGAADPGAAAFSKERERLPSGVPVTLLFNKCDLTGVPPRIDTTPLQCALTLSATTGAGLDLLRAHLKDVMGFQPAESGSISARRRHLDALARSRRHVDAGAVELRERHAGELMAEELRLAHQALGEITGEVSSDELLGKIFATFCIGK